jgi:hypothetical protein
MARPARIEKLRHGRILCGGAFSLFVETWNWLTSYVDNMKGDFEVNPKTGCIFIDRTNPDSPVVRFRADRLPAGGAGGSVEVAADGPFSPIYDDEGEDPEVVTGFSNCYWQNCGVTQHMSDQSIPGTDGFIALKAGATPSTSGTATLYCYADLAALQAAQGDVEYFTVPLYRVASSKITLDMRRMPVVFTAEVLP